MITATVAGGANPAAAASSAIQSSISVYLNCPTGITFAAPGASGSCGSGDFTAIYSGISEIVGSTQDSVFYMASAKGVVVVNFSLTDTTSGKVLIDGVGYHSISSETCASPDLVVPASFTSSTNEVSSGDKLMASLRIVFTGTGTPTFCSGGSKATLISFGTTVVTGSSQPVFATSLKAGLAFQTTIGGYRGVSVSYVNSGNASFTAIVLGVLKDSAGRTVDVLSTSINATSNVPVAAFLVFKQYASGTYTVTMFAITTQEVPVSAATVTTVSV